ncbi:hypothetical protein AMTR_s00125p00056340 [Amborella trichopoda]|uniref:Uncharacterized protein n=1 Tax=Amborella trichopoda TaxID=13333 RepID=W1NQ02_AMBTC|nr:hypothetical protein AMTR_s00125p00056340 [Amborella trichopoda]
MDLGKETCLSPRSDYSKVNDQGYPFDIPSGKASFTLLCSSLPPEIENHRSYLPISSKSFPVVVLLWWAVVFKMMFLLSRSAVRKNKISRTFPQEPFNPLAVIMLDNSLEDPQEDAPMGDDGLMAEMFLTYEVVHREKQINPVLDEANSKAMVIAEGDQPLYMILEEGLLFIGSEEEIVAIGDKEMMGGDAIVGPLEGLDQEVPGDANANADGVLGDGISGEDANGKSALLLMEWCVMMLLPGWLGMWLI